MSEKSFHPTQSPPESVNVSLLLAHLTTALEEERGYADALAGGPRPLDGQSPDGVRENIPEWRLQIVSWLFEVSFDGVGRGYSGSRVAA